MRLQRASRTRRGNNRQKLPPSVTQRLTRSRSSRWRATGKAGRFLHFARAAFPHGGAGAAFPTALHHRRSSVSRQPIKVDKTEEKTRDDHHLHPADERPQAGHRRACPMHQNAPAQVKRRHHREQFAVAVSAFVTPVGERANCRRIQFRKSARAVRFLSGPALVRPWHRTLACVSGCVSCGR